MAIRTKLLIDTPDPFDSVPRLLDCARRGGIDLVEMAVRPSEAGGFQVFVELRHENAGAVATFVARTTQINSAVQAIEADPPNTIPSRTERGLNAPRRRGRGENRVTENA